MQRIADKIAGMERQLAAWSIRIDALDAEAGGAGGGAGFAYRVLIDELILKHEQARLRIDELRAAGVGDWERLDSGLDRAWQDLETAFERLPN